MSDLKRAILAAAVAVLPITAAQAGESNYGWCEITVRGGDPYYQTGVLEIPKGQSETAEREFGQFARGNFDSSIDWDGSCWTYYSSPADAKSMLATRKDVIETQEHKSIRYTDWTGSYAPTGANSSKRKPATAAASSRSSTEDAAPTSPSHRPKMTNAEADAKFAADKAEYQRKLAQNAAEYKAAQKSVEDQKSEQRAAAQRALTAYQQQLQAHEQAVRNQQEAHAAEVAKYESELAARKVRADFDKRNGLGKASTDTDANRCVTTAETRLNDTFKGNTSASIINGCGQPVDVRICLMTDRGWNCGVRWGVASQARASFSSFNATGQVFVDAKITGSAKALASPN